jgi:hopanoid biosynthesis associated protein HpnK
MAKLIVNADDFGASPAVNAAVALAHREGILTSASLMVTAPAAAEAVAIARAHPGLAVGLHLALADARPALATSAIPELLGADGRLERDPLRAGLRYAASAAAREALRREIAAQFAAFAATGLPLSHVDGHHHLHVHPAVLPVAAGLAARHGAYGVRLPGEGLRALHGGAPRAVAEAMALGALAGVWRGVLRREGLAWAAESHGALRSGGMHEAYVLELLGELRGSRSVELFFHPSTGSSEPGEPRGPNPADLASLVSPAVRRAVLGAGFELATYAALRAA